MSETVTRDADGLSIACNLDASELAKRRAALRRDLFDRASERRELPDGYAYRFPGSDEFQDKLLAFAVAERTCCAFFRIDLAFEPEMGPIWLTLRGPEGVKDFIQLTFEGKPDRLEPAVDERVARRPHGDESVTERNKTIVRRLVNEVLNAGRMEVVDELFAPTLAADAKRWIAPFRASFPDMRMEVIALIAEDDTVVGRFACSGTHLGEWLGHAPTGRRFKAVDEVSIHRFREERIVETWTIEDNLSRLEQLGLR